MAVIQRNDFYNGTSVLHPLVIGSILLLVVFFWVRVTSARALSGMTVFSMLVNLTLGSTMSRIITQPDLNLTRGLISVATIIGFEYVTDALASRRAIIAKLLEKRPELLVYRGQIDTAAMRKNRLSENSLWTCLRQHGCLDLSEVEAVVLEMSGQLSVIKAFEKPETTLAPSLERVPGYIEKRDEWNTRHANKNERIVPNGGVESA
ncbi:hypothetical protein P389DRAFT_105065 [Cystobasidium minutum MCA 4210]|uniref:uncharacterized protein n=1 Tax=Cystobasidium minutum MCA 4210 TaxID=1397322 RepID=UPI0034CF07C6|eukprot:jgi/Rhomi1/105065/CE105064_370